MHTEWIISAAGGILIGSAALLLYATSGRIAGISGISFGLLTGASDRGWRWWFLGGLLLGGWLAAALSTLEAAAPPFSLDTAARMLGAGLLVGIGTRLGNGCTSGHGVCGLARLSARSVAATISFMAAGMLTATILAKLAGA